MKECGFFFLMDCILPSVRVMADSVSYYMEYHGGRVVGMEARTVPVYSSDGFLTDTGSYLRYHS